MKECRIDVANVSVASERQIYRPPTFNEVSDVFNEIKE